MPEPRRSLRPLGLALVCCVVLWTLVGVAIAHAEAPLSVGNYSTPEAVTSGNEYEPSSSAATMVNLEVRTTSSAGTCGVAVEIPGSALTIDPISTGSAGESRADASFVLAAKAKFKATFSGSTCQFVFYTHAELKGGEGPAGKEGKEGPAGKEGLPGAEGKAGAAGASGPEVREISEEDVLYLLGGLAIATCVFLVSKVVMP
jgi:hypothetical protein